MRRFVLLGGKGTGTSFKGRLLLSGIILLVLVFLVFLAFAALTILAVLIPAGIVFYLLRKIFLPRKKKERRPEAELRRNNGGSDIIEITDFKRMEEKDTDNKSGT